MPVKLGKKKYKTFGRAVGALRRKGYSKKSAQRIVGFVESKVRKSRSRKR